MRAKNLMPQSTGTWRYWVMASEWSDAELGTLCAKIGSGATPRGGEKIYLATGDVSLIRSQNVHNDGFKVDGLVYIAEEHADQLANVTVEHQDVLLNLSLIHISEPTRL